MLQTVPTHPNTSSQPRLPFPFPSVCPSPVCPFASALAGRRDKICIELSGGRASPADRGANPSTRQSGCFISFLPHVLSKSHQKVEGHHYAGHLASPLRGICSVLAPRSFTRGKWSLSYKGRPEPTTFPLLVPFCDLRGVRGCVHQEGHQPWKQLLTACL